MPMCPAKMVINRWVKRKYQQKWDDLKGHSHSKLILREVSLGGPGGTILTIGRWQIRKSGAYKGSLWSEGVLAL